MTLLGNEPPYALTAAPAPTTQPLAGLREADFILIGAGYGGLLTAIDLASAAPASWCWRRGARRRRIRAQSRPVHPDIPLSRPGCAAAKGRSCW